MSIGWPFSVEVGQFAPVIAASHGLPLSCQGGTWYMAWAPPFRIFPCSKMTRARARHVAAHMDQLTAHWQPRGGRVFPSTLRSPTGGRVESPRPSPQTGAPVTRDIARYTGIFLLPQTGSVAPAPRVCRFAALSSSHRPSPSRNEL